MSLFDQIIPRNPLEAFEATQVAILGAQNADLQEEIGHLGYKITELSEDLLRISDAFDNIGWAPLDTDDATEIPLDTVKKVSKVARGMNALNPFVNQGVRARHGYIWGKGVTFDGVDDISDQIQRNRRRLFSPQAYEEFETALATDGNLFLSVPIKATDQAFRVGLDEIVGVITNPIDKEDIWLYKRDYTVESVNGQTGEVTKDHVIKYYASMHYYQKLQAEGKNLPKRTHKFGIEQNYVIQHTAVNRQVGWRWGVPDIMPVIFWAKAYKEYLEDNAMLVKAYSRLAWKVQVSNSAAGAGVAAQTMTPPTRDPITGELRHVGATSIAGTGTELSPIAAVGSSVDFTKGSPLASAIAAGLGVPMVVITSNSGDGTRATAETLDLTTLKTMESRQAIHTERFLELFEFWGVDIVPNAKRASDLQEAGIVPNAATNKPGVPEASKPANTSVPKVLDHAIVTWPQIETDTTKDRVTALGTAVELGIMFKQEARKEVIDVFGIAPYKPWDELPTMADDPAAQEQQVIQQQNADREFANQQELTKQTVIDKQGVSGGTAAKGGAQTSNNSARDNRAADRKNS
jgi:hypothetical protein